MTSGDHVRHRDYLSLLISLFVRDTAKKVQNISKGMEEVAAAIVVLVGLIKLNSAYQGSLLKMEEGKLALKL